MDDTTQPTPAGLLSVLVHTSDGGKVPKEVTTEQAADLATRFHVEVQDPDGGPSLPWADYLAAKPAEDPEAAEAGAAPAAKKTAAKKSAKR